MSVSQPRTEDSSQSALPSSPQSPKRTSLLHSLTERLSVSEERKQVVLTDIVEGSSPKPLYYILEGLSAVIASFGLLVVAVILTYYLVGVVQDARTNKTINSVLEAELAADPTTTLEKFLYYRNNGWLDVFSTVLTPRVLSPQKVKRMEEALSQHVGEPVRLFVRCSLTKDVTATGATSLLTGRNLDGKFTTDAIAPEAQTLQAAEQVIREILINFPQVTLNDIELVTLPTGPVLVVSVQMPRAPLPVGIQRLEKLLQERVGDPRTRLIIRVINSVDISSKGRILLGQAHFGAQSAEEVALQEALEQAAQAGIEQTPNLFVINIDAAKSEAGWAVRAEVVGPRVPSPAEVHTLETTLQKLAGQPVMVSLWARTEVVVTGQRYSSVKEYAEAASSKNTPATVPPAPETPTATQP